MRSKFRLLPLVLVSFLPGLVFAQDKKDTIQVKYSQQQQKQDNATAYFINGVLLDIKNPIFSPEEIISIEIKNETPSGEIYIKTKNDGKLVFLTPLEIKKKYAKLATSSAIYFVDGHLVDESLIKIEEGYILSVNVTLPKEMKLKGANRNLSLIQITTRSKENVEKSKQIRIKGLGK